MRWSLRYLVLVLLMPIGCGDDSSPTEPAGNPRENVSLSATAATSLGQVRLVGLPSKKPGAPHLVHLLLDEGGHEVIHIESDAEGPFIRAPFHPTQPNSGGMIKLQVSDGLNTGPEMTLDLAALPEAPGAFGRVVQALKAHVEQRATWAGTSLTALQGMTFDAVSPELLSLKIAQSYVESGDDNVDLVSLVTNDAGFLNATQGELLDRIFGYAPLDELLQAEIDAFDQLKSNTAVPALKGEKIGGCVCYWDLTITGEGNWAGDFVTHDFGQFSPIFMISIGDHANSQDGS